ncbi:carnosine N-methyltransferase unmet-like [Saccoglossus kowalevskii]
MCLEDQLHPVEIPDVNPADLQPSAAFSMAAGDFVEVYKMKIPGTVLLRVILLTLLIMCWHILKLYIIF